MSLFELCGWLQHTALATSIAESSWLFPVIEGTHILALPISVGMIVLFDLRLLGLAFHGGAAGKVMSEFARWSRFGFPVMFLTGGLLFLTQAEKAYTNAFFRFKLFLLVLLAVNAALYQIVLYPKMKDWDLEGRTPLGARFCGMFSLFAWLAVIVCGRTMAYQL